MENHSEYERIKRLVSATHVVCMEDSIVYKIESVERKDGDILINVGGGLFLKDTDILTLNEATSFESFLNSIKNIR